MFYLWVFSPFDPWEHFTYCWELAYVLGAFFFLLFFFFSFLPEKSPPLSLSLSLFFFPIYFSLLQPYANVRWWEWQMSHHHFSPLSFGVKSSLSVSLFYFSFSLSVMASANGYEKMECSSAFLEKPMTYVAQKVTFGLLSLIQYWMLFGRTARYFTNRTWLIFSCSFLLKSWFLISVAIEVTYNGVAYFLAIQLNYLKNDNDNWIPYLVDAIWCIKHFLIHKWNLESSVDLQTLSH